MFKKEEALLDKLEELSKSDNPIANNGANILECTSYFTSCEHMGIREALVKAISLDIITYVLKFGLILGQEERETYYNLVNLDELAELVRSDS